MPPENNPRAWPLAVAIYGHDVRVVSDPAMLDRELFVHDRAWSKGAGLDARRIPRSVELAGLWGYRAAGTTRTVDTHAGRVRRALAAAAAVGWMPSTWGVGYRLAP